MVTVKILFTIATFFAVGSCSTIGQFFFAGYETTLYSAFSDLDFSRRECTGIKTNSGRYNEVKTQAEQCFGELSQRKKSFCQTLEDDIKKCSQPLVDYLVDCLPDKSKDVPPAITKGTVSVIDAFCTSTGELLLELASECLYEYLRERDPAVREECQREILEPKLKKLFLEPHSKTEICKIYEELGNCWQESVNRSCESQTAKEVFTKFYNAVLSPCKP